MPEWMLKKKGFERQTKEKKEWHWMTNWAMAQNTKNDNTTLNTKTRKNGDSKCMNKYEKRLWMSTPNGTKCQKWREIVMDFGCRTKK